LVTGLVIRRVVHETAGVEVQLKWPNDLIWHDKKLGGVLVELKAESHGPCYVVVGIGINVSGIPAQLDGTGNWPGGVVDLYTATNGTPPQRNGLAARLIGVLGSMLRSYSERGFSAYREEYDTADYLLGRQVSVQDGSTLLAGVAGGVDADGALRVNTGDAIERVIAGDVSVRTVR
jgi:BirA family biotin operon repressor/biotin-[acetyl-CoA-carboxylase] ligase